MQPRSLGQVQMVSTGLPSRGSWVQVCVEQTLKPWPDTQLSPAPSSVSFLALWGPGASSGGVGGTQSSVLGAANPLELCHLLTSASSCRFRVFPFSKSVHGPAFTARSPRSLSGAQSCQQVPRVQNLRSSAASAEFVKRPERRHST